MDIYFFNSSMSKSTAFPEAFLVAILIIPFSFLSMVNAVSFQISRFTPGLPTILYRGDATTSAGAIEFNNVNYLCRVAQAIYSDPIPIWDSGSGRVADFTTHFTFMIDTLESKKYGHGLVFFLAPVDFQIPPNSAGGFLAMFNTSNEVSSQNHIVSVEFDSFSNPDWDPPFQHVGINNNSIASAVTAPWNASLYSDLTGDAWITYNSSAKNLTVTWSYGSNPASSLSHQMDLKTILPERVIIGFAAATGEYVERHTLQSWEFSSNLDMKPGSKTRKTWIILGLTIPGGALIVCGIIIALMVLRKRGKPGNEKNPEISNLTGSMNDDLERGAGPKRFSYKELAIATHNFSKERKLGKGGFGEVYKGNLVDTNVAVAVKKFSRGSRQGKKEYITEVKIISSLRHRNLVQLIGWCHDNGEFLLVYEFMPNGSLDSHLFGKKSLLGWALRYKIALGLGSALLYLHEEWEQCVIHRDIKSSNIMLDSSFNVKLGDFGLARLTDHELGLQTTGLAGTFGYLAPEYISTGRASKESDVYSFGVVVLEIASGRKSADARQTDDRSETGLVEHVWDLYGSGELVLGLDERLKDGFDRKEAECLLVVGLWCAHPNPNLRPSIRQAIQALHFEASLPKLPTKMPVPMYDLPRPPTTHSSSSDPVMTGATITSASITVGR